MMRSTGIYSISTTLGESVRAFVLHPLPPTAPALNAADFSDLNRQAELALARLAGVCGSMPSVDWLLYSAIRKEALLTSQIEGTQTTLTDLLNEEAGFKVRMRSSISLKSRLRWAETCTLGIKPSSHDSPARIAQMCAVSAR
jgi:Fic/DOC family N-terminal